MNLLKELAVADDRAAIVVTHDPRVYSFADRVVHMEDGLVAKVESIVTPSSADSTNDTAH